MVEVSFADGTLTASDPTGNSTTLDPRGWEARDASHEFVNRVTTAVGGVTAGLALPTWSVVVDSLDDGVDPASFVDSGDGGWNSFGDAYSPVIGERLELPAGRYQIRVATQPVAFVRFDAAATVEIEGTGATVSFDAPRRVTVGVRSDTDVPEATVRVPRSPAGVATALSAFPAALRTTTPDRSFPTLRRHPPLVEFGEEHVPERVRDEVPDVDVTVETPDAIADLFAVAPLAMYLGADVRATDRESAVLRFGDAEQPLPPAPAVAPAARSLLHRVFGLDCLVRNAGEHGTDLAELDALPDGFADDWVDEPSAARLERYLAPDLDPVVDVLPPLRYDATLEPRVEHATVLPALLANLCAVRLPEEPPGEGPPTGRFGLHARIGNVDAPGVPVDDTGIAFDVPPEAYDHRLRETDGERRVVCAAARADAADALDRAAARYRLRDRTSPTVETVAGVTRDALADVLGGSTILLHYAGDCDPERGIRCADGWLDPVDVAVDTTVVLLDAPRSLAVGRRLVESGAVAAVCTPADDPLDPTPLLGGLLLDGGSTGGATAIARRYDAVGDHARVVGDGSYTILAKPMLLIGIEERANGTAEPFALSAEALSVPPGALFRLEETRPRLAGNSASVPRTIEAVRENLAGGDNPVVREDEAVVWPEETDRLLYPFA